MATSRSSLSDDSSPNNMSTSVARSINDKSTSVGRSRGCSFAATRPSPHTWELASDARFVSSSTTHAPRVTSHRRGGTASPRRPSACTSRAVAPGSWSQNWMTPCTASELANSSTSRTARARHPARASFARRAPAVTPPSPNTSQFPAAAPGREAGGLARTQVGTTTPSGSTDPPAGETKSIESTPSARGSFRAARTARLARQVASSRWPGRRNTSPRSLAGWTHVRQIRGRPTVSLYPERQRPQGPCATCRASRGADSIRRRRCPPDQGSPGSALFLPPRLGAPGRARIRERATKRRVQSATRRDVLHRGEAPLLLTEHRFTLGELTAARPVARHVVG